MRSLLRQCVFLSLLSACAGFVLPGHVYGQAPSSAPIMPLAAQSLLLDISSAGERIVVAGERGHILYSDDQGVHWQQANVPTVQMLTGVHFIDAQYGWAAGHDGLVLASDDGGANWRVQRNGLSAQHQANLEARESAYQAIRQLEQALVSADDEQRDELAMALEDAQLDLEDADIALAEPVHTPPLMDIWFQDENHGWAVGAFGTFLATSDGGLHWRDAREYLDNPDEFHLNAITGDGRGRVFIAGEGGVLYRSLDGGERWQSLEPIYHGSWFGAVYEAESDALLVFGLQGTLYRSGDFGDSWQMLPNDSSISLAGGNARGGNIVIVGGVGTVLTSDDGGHSFSHGMLSDRLSLSNGLPLGDRLLLVGQGGAKLRATGGEQ